MSDRLQRTINAYGAYLRLAHETGDYSPYVAFLEAMAHRVEAEVAAASEAIAEERLMSEKDVQRHYARLYPDESDEESEDPLPDDPAPGKPPASDAD